MPSSKLKEALARHPRAGGLHRGLRRGRRPRPCPGRSSRSSMKYTPDRQRTISGLRRVSKPGLRVCTRRPSVPRVLGGMGIAILSTNQGLMTDREGASAGSAARSSARSGNGARHVTNRQDAHHRSRAASRSRSTAATSRSRARREPSSATSPETITVSREGDELLVDGPTTSARTARCTGSPARWSTNMVIGVLRGLQRASSRSSASATAHGAGPDAARARSSATRHPVAVDAPDGIDVRGAAARPASRCGASTSSSSARWPPTSARSASPSPTRARASATSDERVLRKAGKSAK